MKSLWLCVARNAREEGWAALGAQRALEARIGQLLGPSHAPGSARHAEDFNDEQRNEFRLLARALKGECELSEDEWRKSRRAELVWISHPHYRKEASHVASKR